jgi:hypothetical protein
MLYTNCDTAIAKKTWTIVITQVHNEFDTTLSYFGHLGHYLTNSIRECFVHCYLTGFTSDPTGNTFGNFMAIDKKLGRWSYYIKRPFYWTVNFSCDNGFQRFSYSF